MHACMWVCAYACACSAHGGQQRVPDSPEADVTGGYELFNGSAWN